jgi:hypothetical protein
VHPPHNPICPSPRLRTMILTTVHQYAQMPRHGIPPRLHTSRTRIYTYVPNLRRDETSARKRHGRHPPTQPSLHTSPSARSCDVCTARCFCARASGIGAECRDTLLAGIPHCTAPPCQRVLWKTGYLRPGVAVGGRDRTGVWVGVCGEELLFCGESSF